MDKLALTHVGVLATMSALAGPIPVYAQTVNATTSCGLVGAVMDREQPDRIKVREIASYIEETFRTVDKSYKVRGKVEIVPRLSQDGLNRLIAATTVKCRDETNRTIQEVALEIYDSARELQKVLGAAD